MKKITAEVRVGHCTLTEQWVAVVPDELAEQIAGDPSLLLDYDGPIDITNENTDNEDERNVDPDMDVVPFSEREPGLPVDVLFNDAVIGVRWLAWRRASEDLESAATTYIKSYVRHKYPTAAVVHLYGDRAFTGEVTELRVHIVGIDLADGSPVDGEDVEDVDDACEGALMYLAGSTGDDYDGEHEIKMEVRVST